MATADEQVIVDGQRAVAVNDVAGSYIYDGGATDIQCVVKSGDKAQRAIKVVNLDGGGQPLFKKIIIKDTTIPAASAANANEMYIYAGATNDTYTHGYIYENQYTPTFEGIITFDPAVITVSTADYGAFLTAGTQYISNPTSITHGTMTYHSSSAIWRMDCYDESNNLVGYRQLYQSDYEDAGFVFTGTFEDEDVVNFTTSITESSSSYQWVRIDVQPNSGSSVRPQYVDTLPEEGEEGTLYLVNTGVTRDGYAIFQMFVWKADASEYVAIGAYDVGIDPNGIVYEQSFNTGTNTMNVTVGQESLFPDPTSEDVPTALASLPGYNSNAPLQSVGLRDGNIKWITREYWYSGFSNSNYNTAITTKQTLPASFTDLDIIMEIEISADSGNIQQFFVDATTGYNFAYNGAGVLGSWSSEGSFSYNETLASGVNNRWLRIKGSSGSYTIYTLADNDYTIESLPELSSWNNAGTAPTSMFSPGVYYRLGGAGSSSYWPRELTYFKNFFMKADSSVLCDLRKIDDVNFASSISRIEYWK